MNLPVERTKTYQQRLLPMGQRLRSILEMCQTDPKGQSWPPSACVFGNEVGELIKSVKTAWKATCRRAGITDLHFNDLRHEFGCRLLESGSGLHDVRGFLGHASITTTFRYLQSSSHRLADALTRMETRQPARVFGKCRTNVAQNVRSATRPSGVRFKRVGFIRKKWSRRTDSNR